MNRTEQVLALVAAERERQEALYPDVNDRLESGMGPGFRWLLPYTTDSAADIQRALREDYEDWEEDAGLPTWMHLIREEIAEAFEQQDLARQAEELIQVAALCVSRVERILAG